MVLINRPEKPNGFPTLKSSISAANKARYGVLTQHHTQFDGNCCTLSSPTGNIVWMALRRGDEEPRIDSAEVDMPFASAAPYHGRCR